MKVRNQLKILMAKNDISSVAHLSRETGIFYDTLLSFYHQRYEVLNTKMIAVLCEYFGCKIEELLVLVEEKAS